MVTNNDPRGNKEIEFQSESVSDARAKGMGGFMPGENRLAAQFFRTTDGGYGMFHLNCLDQLKSREEFDGALRDAVMEGKKLTVRRASSKDMTTEQLNTPCRICGIACALEVGSDKPIYVPPPPKPPEPTTLETTQANEIERLSARLTGLEALKQKVDELESSKATEVSTEEQKPEPSQPSESPHRHRYNAQGKCKCGATKGGK